MTEASVIWFKYVDKIWFARCWKFSSWKNPLVVTENNICSFLTILQRYSWMHRKKYQIPLDQNEMSNCRFTKLTDTNVWMCHSCYTWDCQYMHHTTQNYLINLSHDQMIIRVHFNIIFLKYLPVSRFQVLTFRLMSSNQGITLQLEICISPIDHYAHIGSWYTAMKKISLQ